ncbi:MAG TPA: 3'(2'),5'-bisphosphate nucleotidase CysQ [Acetobacteraceae bacterium]|jgi:3'(2'), 5'-bisphosphate nucleotidase
MGDDELISLAAMLALEAGAAILDVRRRGFDVERKEDRSPVTEADRAAEALIATGLRGAMPDIPVIAEEEVAAGRITAPAATYWLVDPLDGTREFAAGNDEFAVNIGLVREDRPVLGVVAIPATGELFGGIVGRGAWKRVGSRQTPVSARLPPAEGLTVLASRYHGSSARLDEFLRDRRVAKLINFGSSIKFCRLAEGVADLYPRFGRTMEWDTCAPQAVLEAAGGTVRTFDGEQLRYGKPGWENPHFVCTGRADH